MSKFLVLAATGKTGKRVARQLEAGGHEVRAARRDVTFDWDDASTYGPALAGVEGVYIVPPPARDDYPPLVAEFVQQANAAGVKRLVALSARGANFNPEGALALLEGHVKAAQAQHTIIRPTWFMQNFNEGYFVPTPENDFSVVAPVGDGAEPFVDVEDIAAVAVAALTEDGHAGEEYDMSGPEAVTFDVPARLLSERLGREIRYVDPGAEGWRKAAIEGGLPEVYADMLLFLFSRLRSGEDARLSDGVQRALGREPNSLDVWAAREVGVGGAVA